MRASAHLISENRYLYIYLETSNPKKAELESITKLLRDPVIVRMVTVIDVASLSILELLEYGLTRQDISHSLNSNVVEIKKTALPDMEITSVGEMLVVGDILFNQSLNTKLKLTALGIYLLDCIKSSNTEQEILENARQKFFQDSDSLNPPEYLGRTLS